MDNCIPSTVVPAHVVLPADKNETPNRDWPLDRLAGFATEALATTHSIESSLPGLVRKSVTSFFRAGKALWIAREQLKQVGQWVQWQDDNKLPRTQVFECIQLFEAAKTEDAIQGMTVMQAKQFFLRPKAKSERKQKPSSKHGSAAKPIDPLAQLDVALGTLEAVVEYGRPHSQLHYGFEKRLRAIYLCLAEIQQFLLPHPIAFPPADGDVAAVA